MEKDRKIPNKKAKIRALLEIAILVVVCLIAVSLEMFFSLHKRFEDFMDKFNINMHPFQLNVAGSILISIFLYVLFIYFRKAKEAENALMLSRKLENDVERSKDELEERVQRRTVELARTNVDLNDEIAEHKKTEESLRSSEAKYRLLTESLPQGIFIKNRDSVYISCNENYARSLGIKSEEISGKTDFDFYSENLADQYRAVDRRIMDSGQPEEMDEPIRFKGKEAIIHIVKNPIKDASGNITGIIGIFWDVTELRRNEEEITVLKKRIEFILGATKTGLDIIDADFNIIYIDPEWSKIYGDPKGRKCFEYFMGRSSICPGCGLKKALETKQLVVSEEVLIKEGNRPVQVISFPHQDESGKWLVAEVNIDISERKKMELSLKKSEIKARAILDQSFGFIGLMTLDGILIDANKAALEFSGIEISAVLNKPFWDTPWWIHSPELQKKLRQAIKQAAAGEFVRFEATHLDKNRALKYIDFSIKAVKDENGRVIFLIPEGREITDLKMMEEALRQHRNNLEKTVAERTEALKISETRYRRLFEAARDGILILNFETGKIEDVNPYMLEMLGFSREEFLDRKLWDIGTFKDALLSKVAFKELQDKGYIRYEDLPLQAKDGKLIHFEFVSNVYTINSHRVIQCNIRNITERKLTQDKIKESEAKFRAIFDNASDGIVLANVKKQRFVMGNKAFCEMLGYTAEEVTKLTVEDIHPKETLDSIMNDFEKFYKGEIKYSLDKPVRRKDGKIFYVDITASGIKLNNEDCLLGSFRDVTERKQLAQAIAEVIKVKEEFTGKVSHELRTPLAALKEGISQVVGGLLGKINPEQKRMLNISRANVDRLARLISNVLDLQKFDSNQMKINLELGDINVVVKDIRDSSIALAKKRKIYLKLRLGKELPKIKFDKDKIIQVLANLVNNAIVLTDKGGIIISTSCGDNYIRVSVEDTGPGIKEEDIQKIFERFVQLVKRPGATGLGLSICKEIVEAHNGKIWVDSKFGKGSVFSFILPVEERRGNAK
ncbi:MAG: PAS domain S-box protein [Candidatus Omnitrophota bacterium]